MFFLYYFLIIFSSLFFRLIDHLFLNNPFMTDPQIVSWERAHKAQRGKTTIGLLWIVSPLHTIMGEAQAHNRGTRQNENERAMLTLSSSSSSFSLFFVSFSLAIEFEGSNFFISFILKPFWVFLNSFASPCILFSWNAPIRCRLDWWRGFWMSNTTFPINSSKKKN